MNLPNESNICSTYILRYTYHVYTHQEEKPHQSHSHWVLSFKLVVRINSAPVVHVSFYGEMFPNFLVEE